MYIYTYITPQFIFKKTNQYRKELIIKGKISLVTFCSYFRKQGLKIKNIKISYYLKISKKTTPIYNQCFSNVNTTGLQCLTVFTAMTKPHDQKQLEEEGVYVSLQLNIAVHFKRKSGHPNLKDAAHCSCLPRTTCTAQVNQTLFHQSSRKCPHVCPQTSLVRAFSQWSFPIHKDSSLCQADLNRPEPELGRGGLVN